MGDSRQHAAKFVEKEIKTYLALALFFTKMGIKTNGQTRRGKVQLSPSFYRERMKEAKELLVELRSGARR